eukprot:TRINITY_DN5872_c0_g1_i1.p1 TRINITY_DN5872_c0_g1~~TRINITY_DN5872_c0_g1_i1.p1  ORF type:complete len:609 (+),score=124.01 TRINITY_DN5872_c0_g1_i1:149-1828(+)
MSSGLAVPPSAFEGSHPHQWSPAPSPRGKPVAPETCTCFGQLRGLRRNFGARLLGALVIVQWLLKGAVAGAGGGGWIGQPQDFIFRSYKVSAARMQVLKAATATPWSLKPFIGILSDAVPICRYHKLPYMLVATLLAIVGYYAVATGADASVEATTLQMWFIVLQVALCDLMTEAVYTARMRHLPELGPDLVSFVWAGIQFASLVSNVSAGSIIGSYGPRACYAVGGPVAALVLFTVLFNHIGEQPSERGINSDLFRSHGRLVTVGIGMGLLSIAMTVLNVLVHNEVYNLLGALVACVILVVSMFWACREYPQVAMVNSFFVVQHALAISIEGASFYFFTDNSTQYPEGPHLSVSFYVSVLGGMSSVCSMLGIWAYNRWMGDWSYRSVIVVGNLVQGAASLISCLIYLRVNVKLGIPDDMFLVTSTVVGSVLAMFTWVPGMLIISQLCPKGAEATMFALLAGSQNFGQGLGVYFGAFLLHIFKVTPHGHDNESHAFDNLWKVAVIGTLLPLLPLLIVRRCIPGASQREGLPAPEPLLGDHPEDTAPDEESLQPLLAQRT